MGRFCKASQFIEYMCEGTLNYWPSSANDFLTWPVGHQLWHLSHLSRHAPSVSEIYTSEAPRKETLQSFTAVLSSQRNTGELFEGLFMRLRVGNDHLFCHYGGFEMNSIFVYREKLLLTGGQTLTSSWLAHMCLAYLRKSNRVRTWHVKVLHICEGHLGWYVSGVTHYTAVN